MVASNRLPGITVAVCVNDEPLTEYEDPTFRPTLEDTRSIVAARQIMSTAGDNFFIRMSLDPSFEMRTEGLWFDVRIDGSPVRGRLFWKSAFEERGRNLASVVRGVEEGSGAVSVIRLFKFADVLTTDEIPADAQCMSKEDLAKSGIVVRVFEAGVPLELPETPASANEDFLVESKEKAVHETLVKGQMKLHTVGLTYGKIESSQAIPVAILKPLHKDPLAIFRFQYRSKEALQLIGTMAPTPGPELSAKFPEMKIEPICIKQEKSYRAATEPATPSPRRANAADLLGGMSPGEQATYTRLFEQSWSNLGREPAPAGPSPTKVQKKAPTPANSPTKPRVKKTPKKNIPVSVPLRVIQENGQNVLDLTMDD